MRIKERLKRWLGIRDFEKFNEQLLLRIMEAEAKTVPDPRLRFVDRNYKAVFLAEGERLARDTTISERLIAMMAYPMFGGAGGAKVNPRFLQYVPLIEGLDEPKKGGK